MDCSHVELQLTGERIHKGYGGVEETNPLPYQNYHEEDIEYISLGELKDMYNEGKKIKAIRLRLVSDVGYPSWDMSYFHVSVDGVKYGITDTTTDNGNSLSSIPKKYSKKHIYKWVKDSGIFIQDLFGSISTLI